jgi:outer membrane receptor for ferrienterochelin and colicin
LLRLSWHDFELNVNASVNHKSWPLGFPRRQEVASDYDERENYELERRLWADLKRRTRLSQHVELTTRVYGDSFEYNRYSNVSTTYYCQYEGVTTCKNTTLGLSRWLGAEVQTNVDWFNDTSFVSLLGVDGRIRYAGYKVDHEDYDTGVALESSSSVLRETDTMLGVYLQQTWQPGEIFGLNAGARVDAYSAFGSRVSPRVAATAQVWPGATLKAVYSEAFRAPNWYEAESTGGLRIEARGLDPETVRSVDFSIEQKLRTHRLLWGVFRSWWYDMIQLQTLSPDELSDAQRRGEAPFGIPYATQFRNVAHIDSYGYNAGYDGSAYQGRLTFGANVTGAYSRQERRGLPGAPVPLAPHLSGNARIAYALPDLWPTLGVAAHYLGARPSDVALDTDYANPPYSDPQLQLRGTVSGAVPYVPGLSYRATANYAFSENGGYVVGLVDPAIQPLFSPVDTFRVTAGLQFDF